MASASNEAFILSDISGDDSDNDKNYLPDDESTDKSQDEHDAIINLNNLQNGRKRIRRTQTHKKCIRKEKRARGEEYVSTTGKVVSNKTCDMTDCECPFAVYKKYFKLEESKFLKDSTV
uniref:Uncharacterized protein LOC114341657 n=1 Tax=Diabrotica virgifera virgifera TaxID=50390 RepID=A0A6P7GWT0_DIAVI